MKSYAIPKSLGGDQKGSLVALLQHIIVEDVFEEIQMITYDGYIGTEYTWTVRGTEKDASG